MRKIVTGLAGLVGTSVLLALSSPADVAQAAGTATLPAVHQLSRANARFEEGAGAGVTATTRTVPHFHGSFTDPTNHTTYGYNMVGADPATDGDTTVRTVMVPLTLTFASSGGFALSGSAVAPAFATSPVWQNGSYSQTGDTAVQYGDAVMRAQFDKVGKGSHMRLGAPRMLPTETISVPQGLGSAGQIPNGPAVGFVNVTWFAAQLQNLNNALHLDPTTLVVYVTDDVVLYVGRPDAPDNCCILGFHGASEVAGHGTGATHGTGNQPVQTYAWASYLRPGLYPTTDAASDPNGAHFLQDIHGLSHEISEWADDPFINNKVNPWLTPTAPQYGCTDLLETGDPVVGIGFHQGTNTFGQDLPNGADGAWHPEDEALLPWFARQTPSSATGGRYTFMGTDNPFPGFQVPATGC